MSFSKAKIQRFNEVTDSVVGPSARTGNKIKPTSKNGATTHCDKSSDTTKSDTGSSRSFPCFRTPTLLRKKQKTIPTNQTTKGKPPKPFPTDPNLEALKEKLVECENKDAYIKDLTQQLEEFREKFNQIENKTDGLDFENNRIDNLKNEHENKVKIMKEEFKLRLLDTISLKEKLKTELLLLKQLILSYNKEIQDIKNNFGNFNKYAEQFQTIINQKQAELDKKENILKLLEQNTIEMQKQHSFKIEKLRKEQQIEIQDLEFEMLKTMTELQKEKELCANKIKEMEEEMERKIYEMKSIFESDKEKIICQTENRLKELEEGTNLITEKTLEEELSKIETAWKNKLSEQQKQSHAILKECQAISEYNIIQCELEKNNIATELKQNIEELKEVQTNYNEILNNFKELKRSYQQLQQELKSKAEDLETTKTTLQNQLQEQLAKLKEAQKENAAYEFTIKNSQLTIEVLKKRLINSDRDVEQLKEELSEYEKKFLEYEQKNVQLASDLVQAQMFNEKLEMQFESTIELNSNEIDQIGRKLLQDVNDYKKQVIKYKEQSQIQQKLKQEVMQLLHDAHDMIGILKTELETLENQCSHQTFEVEQSRNELDDYHIRELDWEIIRDKLEFTIKDLLEQLERKNFDITDLKKQVSQLQEKVNVYSESSQCYQQKINELEEDQKDTGKIHKKYIEMSGKYDMLACKFEELQAENLQNKMKLMKLTDDQDETEKLKAKYDEQVAVCEEIERANVNLKAEIEQRIKEETSLKKEFAKVKAEREALLNKVQMLESELKQPNTPKKSKVEDKKWTMKNKDKENVNSPNRTLNSPLRDRN